MPSSMVDWDLAVTTASTLAGSGPAISRAEAEAVVAELRAHAERSTGLVREYTGLVAEERSAPLLVVDRTGWIQANVDGFATVISPLVEKLQERKGPPSPMTQAIGSRVTGLELGGLLGFLSSKVLGQFDPFFSAPALPRGPNAGASGAGSSPGAGPSPADGSSSAASSGTTGEPAVATRPAAGRLLLVAPNIVHVERQLAVDPADFRLWVTLHEETHRVQFTAVPWMRDHIHGEIANLVSTVELDPAKLAGLLGEGARRLGDLVRGTDDTSLLDLISTPEQRQVVDRITAVMSLLEGHADVVMDGVGPEVIPSVADIRRKFNRRRKGTSPLDRVLRRLLGLDAKMAQYRNGAAFVRGVIDQVGMPGLNKVWVEPDALPTKDEIADPESWVRRVHG